MIPAEFRLTRVPWSIPIFIVRACEYQAGGGDVSDSVADVLYNEIQPATVDAFRDDPEFMRAYHFPLLD